MLACRPRTSAYMQDRSFSRRVTTSARRSTSPHASPNTHDPVRCSSARRWSMPPRVPMPPSRRSGDRPVREGWTLLTYLAGAFPRFRYGHLVLAQSYRNPALLAKMAATLQHLSDGRFILGLGAGWHEEEYRSYGYPYPSGGTRVAQLAEAIELIRAMWTDSPASYRGVHYQIESAYCEPRPDPPIPILVGTNGPKALAVTG